MKQLTYTFPENATTSNGTPFWSAPKRFPHPLLFSADDPSHLNFLMAASILRAETFGIPIPDWVKSPQKLADAVNRVIVADFQPKKDVKIVTDEKATSLSTASIDDGVVIDELITKLGKCQKLLAPGFKMNPIHFEKVFLSILAPPPQQLFFCSCFYFFPFLYLFSLFPPSRRHIFGSKYVIDLYGLQLYLRPKKERTGETKKKA